MRSVSEFTPRRMATGESRVVRVNCPRPAVCSGRMTLADVQQQIATNWIALGHTSASPASQL